MFETTLQILIAALVGMFVVLFVKTHIREHRAWRMARNIGDHDKAGVWALLMLLNIADFMVFVGGAIALASADDRATAVVFAAVTIALMLGLGLGRRWVRRTGLARSSA